MDEDKKLSLKDELLLDVDALERVLRIVNNSTFSGRGAKKVSSTLEILKALKRSIVIALNQSEVPSETERTEESGT